MLPSKKCNLCNGNKTQFLFRKNSFNIVKCRNCGFVYVDSQLTDIKIPDLYDFDFFEGNKKSRGYSGYLRERDNIMRNSKKRLRRIERYQKRGKLLDVGCAAGFFLYTAGENWEVTGVDISEYMSNYARDKLGLNVVTGRFIECNLPSEYFDVITMWDIIAHTKDPAENLAQAWNLLSRGGLLVLCTLNIGHLLARARGKNWRLMNPPTHLYYFSDRTIRKMLEKVGFDVVKVTTETTSKSLESVLFTQIWATDKTIWSYLDSIVRKLHLGSLRIYLSLGDVMTVYSVKREKA